MAKRKSYRDVEQQAARIRGALYERNGNTFSASDSARLRRVNDIANRYLTNIANARGVRYQDERGVNFIRNERRVSRSTYMGLNNG